MCVLARTPLSKQARSAQTLEEIAQVRDYVSRSSTCAREAYAAHAIVGGNEEAPERSWPSRLEKGAGGFPEGTNSLTARAPLQAPGVLMILCKRLALLFFSVRLCLQDSCLHI